MLTALKNWYSLQTAAAQKCVFGMSVLIIALLAYVLLISPYYHARARLKAELISRVILFAKLQQIESQLSLLTRGRAHAAPVAATQLQSVVAAQLAENDLSGDHPSFEQQGAQLIVRFETVNFDELIHALLRMTQRYDFDLASLKVVRVVGRAGQVTAEIVFQV